MLIALCVAYAGLTNAASMYDPTFNVGTGANWYVEQMLEQPDGKILICGLFSQYNGQSLPYIGRLNPDGSIDPSFHAQPNYWVRHMILLPDGRIVIGGMFLFIGNVPRSLIARLNPDGSLDETFNPGRGGEVSIGTGINNDPTPFIIWMDIQPDGKILATGNFHDYDGVASSGIVRINPDGSRDPTFNVGAGINTWGRFVKVLDNSQIILSGWFSSYDNQTFNRLVRLNSDGSIDHSLNAFFGDKTSVYTVDPLADGKLIVAGHSVNDQKLFSREIERLNPDGSVDATWPTYTDEKVQSILPQPDGKIIIVGQFGSVNGIWSPGIARVNPDGSLDTSLHAEVNGMIWGISQTHDKKLLVCAEFTTIDSHPSQYLARLILPEYLAPALTAPQIVQTQWSGGKFQCAVNSVTNAVYTLQFKDDIAAASWSSLTDVPGTGSMLTFEDTTGGGARFYRVQAH
jgi:uncharacterized delta-60 repeat protein